MRKEIILSDIGVLLGIVGVFIAIIPFLSSVESGAYNIIFPIAFGIVGLILVFKVKKELNDDIVKAGLVVNPLAIFLGIIQAVI